MNVERIKHDFSYHKPDGQTIELHEHVRSVMKATGIELNDVLPESREKSLAITKLEEAMMWAHAAVARNPRPEDTK